MKVRDILAFEKALAHQKPSLCLIIASDEIERQRGCEAALGYFPQPITSFTPTSFVKDAFLQEMETAPFLSKHKTIIVKDIEKIDGEAFEEISLTKLPPWCSLVLSASALSSKSKVFKCVEQIGVLYALSEEKPWEKEKRLVDWVIHEAKKEGVVFPTEAAKFFVQNIDSEELKQELDKLITYVGDRKLIKREDIASISLIVPHETIWQVMDALFQKRGVDALRGGRILFQQGGGLLPLLAQVRGQMHMALNALLIFKKEGKEGVTRAFPYLKGGLLEKKLTLFQQYGETSLQKGLMILFDTELLAKNSAQDPELLLELFLFKLTYDTHSIAQLASTS